ncbi:MAG: nucleotidyltransferase family protein [Oscillospiraceae bacterium]|nr:nucleotidyltransferase family protein [Oscillospiraceae bacterium]
MRTAGIICEYNPFHTGHALHIAKTREALGADTTVICAMSGNFVQRGGAAVCAKHARAEAAVRACADLVFELPTPWAVSSAERFAQGGVSMLAAAGAEVLSFGSESGDANMLRRLAKALLSPDFTPILQEELARGDSFAAARERALRRLVGDEAAHIARPNDLLGVEYCKAILSLGANMDICCIPRTTAQHDGGAGADGYASASHVRKLLCAGEDASAYLTGAMRALYERECAAGRAPVSLANLERAMLARFRAMDCEDFSPYDEGGEGLYRRLYTASRTAASLAELFEKVKTKRYAHARVRRMALCAFLGITASEARLPLPYLRVLACNARGRAHLAGLRGGAVPVLTKPADVRQLGTAAQRLFETEARCTDLYTLACPAVQEGGAEWKIGPVILE